MPRKRDTKSDQPLGTPEGPVSDRTPEPVILDPSVLIPLMDGAPVAVYLTDAAGDCIHANRRWLEHSGLTLEEARGKGWLDALHTDDRDRIGAAWYETVARAGHWELDYRFEDAAGNVTWIHGTADPLPGPQGATSGYIGTNIDITPLKEAEKAARVAETALARAQELAHVGSWEWDVVGEQLTWSDETYRIFGFDRNAELTFERIAAAILLEDRPRNNEWVARLLGHGDTDEIDLRIRRSSGEVRHVHQTAAVERAEDGTPLRAHGTIQDITARKQAEAAAAAHEVRLHALIENADFSVWAVDRDVRLVVGNTTFHRRLREDMGRDIRTGEPLVTDDLPTEVAVEWRGYYERALSGEQFAVESSTHYGSQPGWMDYRFNPIVDRSGVVTGVFVMGRDTTQERRRSDALRQSERQKDLILNSTSEMFAYYDLDLHIRWANRASGESVGRPSDELVGLCCYEVWQGRDEPCDGCPVLIAARTRQPATAEMTTPDGRTFSLRGYPVLDESGELIGLTEFGQDITKQRRLESDLRRSEELLKSAEAITHAGGWEYDVLTGHVVWTDEVYRIYGVDHDFDSDDVVAAKSHYPGEAHAVITEAFERALEKGEPYDLELPFVRADGERIWVRTSARPELEDGRVIRIIGNIVDVTDRRAVSDALRATTERYRSVIAAMHEGVILQEASGRILTWNPAAERVFGIAAEDAIGQTSTSREWGTIREDGSPYPGGEHPSMHTLATGQPCSGVVMGVVRPDGDVRWVSINTEPIWDETADAERYVAAVAISFADITDRRGAEEDLRASEERFRTLVENVPGTVFRCEPTPPWRDLYISDHCEALTGYPATDFLEGRKRWDDLVLKKGSEELAREPDRPGPYSISYRIRHRDGTIRWLHETGSLTRAPDGTPLHFDGVITDITDHKMAEEALRQSEERWRSLTETSPDHVLTLDRDLNIELVNRASPGLTVDELIGTPLWSYVEEERQAEVRAVHQRVLETGKQESYDTSYETPDGETIYYESRASARRDPETGDIVGLTISSRDITARKLAEQAAAEKGRELDDFFSASLDLFCIADTDGYFRRLNQEWANVLGYPLEQMQGARFLDFVHPDDLEATHDAIATLRRQEVVPSFTNRYRCQDGSYRWIEWKSLPRGERIYAAARDITDRIESERALREANERLSVAQRGADAGTWDWDMTTGELSWTREFHELFGLSPDAPATFETWRATLHPDDLEAAEARINDAVERRIPLENEYRIVRPDGTVLWIAARGDMIYDEAGEPRRMSGICMDITARKRAETALRESEERFRGIFDTSPVGITIMDGLQQRFLHVNEGFETITGYSARELEDLTAEDITHPDDWQRERALLETYVRDPDRTTFTIDKRYVRKDGAVRWVQVTGDRLSTGDDSSVVIANVLDITERVQSRRDLEVTTERLRQTLRDTVKAMGTIVELRDPYTAGHEKRVTSLAEAIAAEMDLDEAIREGLTMAGEVHDIGKIAVPAEILSKPSTLTEMEFKLVKQHPTVGHRLVGTIAFERPVAEIVLQHHERLDGSGYPGGLKGDEILLEARILTVADVVEAMASHRPYRPALGLEAALAEVHGGAGTLYDADVVAACDRVFDAGFSFEG